MAQDADSAPIDGRALVERFLEHVQSLGADFSQEIWSADQQLVDRASGTLLIQRPNRFRWNYDEPDEQVILSDGKALRIYTADIKQLTISDLDEFSRSSPLVLLSGDADISDAFDVEGATRAGALVWVSLKPKEADADFDIVRLAFAGDLIQSMEFVDPFDQTTRIDFTNIRVNPVLPKDAFELVVPKGTDILRGTG